MLGCAPITTDNRRETRRDVQGDPPTTTDARSSSSIPRGRRAAQPAGHGKSPRFLRSTSRAASPTSRRAASCARYRPALPLPASAALAYKVFVSIDTPRRNLSHRPATATHSEPPLFTRRDVLDRVARAGLSLPARWVQLVRFRHSSAAAFAGRLCWMHVQHRHA
ncbi:hypothetical protein K525DRAFT_275035 [Schizophyllum commune Loenen D]|nr:hypothetical protein K525DRAFT_275035 [Schizophyllum commune Loenen D]